MERELDESEGQIFQILAAKIMMSGMKTRIRITRYRERIRKIKKEVQYSLYNDNNLQCLTSIEDRAKKLFGKSMRSN